MRKFTQEITAEQETRVRKEMRKLLSNEFPNTTLGMFGTSRDDIEMYIKRDESHHMYNFSFRFNIMDSLEMAKTLTAIDKRLKKTFGVPKINRIIGDNAFVETGETKEDGMASLTGENTRVRLPIVEYWYDPKDVEESVWFQQLLKMNKYNL